MHEGTKALRQAFKERLGDVKKRARRMRAEYFLEADEDSDPEESGEVEIEVKKKASAPDRDSPKKEEKESAAEKRSELLEEVQDFLTKKKPIDTGKVKSVIAAPGPVKKNGGSGMFKKLDISPPKKKGK